MSTQPATADQSNLTAEEKLAQLKAQLSNLYAGGEKEGAQQAPAAADQQTPQAPGSLPFDDFVLGRVREKDESSNKGKEETGLPILDFGGETA
ncbi:uncharacterized protein ACA1_055320 [Acanthamoeba castellanii str. Neff]|uniref:Uncharacterized protein n=1 Tax=Acanthamoeba castellanii (strain ATCC 30010 / Neff) TaxID=1257118 RepID=L8H8H5_ACACF|nr:uncharacterized protein ACA1_055320 [Acanthamoeba castellanii str. Neff]ELR20766.1 hypothetical protein ACA1_055320 [Acanthamoeba castellanii str. Neff]